MVLCCSRVKNLLGFWVLGTEEEGYPFLDDPRFFPSDGLQGGTEDGGVFKLDGGDQSGQWMD
jgi:hypothetical protein